MKGQKTEFPTTENVKAVSTMGNSHLLTYDQIIIEASKVVIEEGCDLRENGDKLCLLTDGLPNLVEQSAMREGF